MALFGRNKDEEFEDEDEFDEKEDRGDRKLTKKFRDLNPKNKKKRREPPKPWGKKERTIVLVILLITVVISAILAFVASGNGRFRFGLPKFDINSLNIFKEETIIVGNK
jgi:hypothetical protein